jgi:predicted dithiol-disulfide oxidoreductase (DUF899 family)
MIDARGYETMGIAWSYLDATPPGREEDREESPEGGPTLKAVAQYAWHNTSQLGLLRAGSPLFLFVQHQNRLHIG